MPALGCGRALVATYAFLALAACARSAAQIATRFEQAPIAFLLSGVSGAVYLLAALCLAREGRRWWLAGTICCSVELVGVVAVGSWSLAAPATFPDPTVWSHFGSGYGYLPVVLPVLGLLWQRRRRRQAVSVSESDEGEAGRWARRSTRRRPMKAA